MPSVASLKPPLQGDTKPIRNFRRIDLPVGAIWITSIGLGPTRPTQSIDGNFVLEDSRMMASAMLWS